MRQEWEILTLGKYLTETDLKSGLVWGTTFARKFPETEQLPELTAGLALIKLVGSSTSIELVPPIKHSPNVLLNSFINEVAEQYLRLSEIVPDHWQEALLLELGYVKKIHHPTKYKKSAAVQDSFILFASIPAEEKLPLLKKHGFHKIATVVAYGHTENIDQILTIIEELDEELPEGANYGTIMGVLALGVPVEDLSMAVQLPMDMVEEIYNSN